MKLSTQKRLASEIMNIGKNKVRFDSLRLEDISKAITRTDIIDLIKDRAIMRKIIKKSEKKKEKRRKGIEHTKIRVKRRKDRYIVKIRKLRRYILELRNKKIISKDEYRYLRKLARAGHFKARRNLIEYVAAVMKKTLPLHKDSHKEKTI